MSRRGALQRPKIISKELQFTKAHFEKYFRFIRSFKEKKLLGIKLFEAEIIFYKGDIYFSFVRLVILHVFYYSVMFCYL